MKFSSDPLPIAPVILRMQLRYDIALSTLGYSETRRLIWRALLVEGEGWSERSLSAYIGRSRSAMHNVLVQLAEAGVVEWVSGGVRLTSAGRKTAYQLHSETLRIVAGEQVGYSEEILAELSTRPGLRITERAKSLSFKRDLPFRIET